MKRPLLRLFFGIFYFYAIDNKPCPKDAAYEIWFMRSLNVFPYISLCKLLIKIKSAKKWSSMGKIVGHFLADFIFMSKINKPCPNNAVCQISVYLEYQFI